MSGRQVEFGFVVTAAGAPGSSDSSMYGWFLEDCELYGALGYRNAWLLEHHFSDYFPTPDPMLLMAHLAGRYPEFSYGTCVIVTPGTTLCDSPARSRWRRCSRRATYTSGSGAAPPSTSTTPSAWTCPRLVRASRKPTRSSIWRSPGSPSRTRAGISASRSRSGCARDEERTAGLLRCHRKSRQRLDHGRARSATLVHLDRRPRQAERVAPQLEAASGRRVGEVTCPIIVDCIVAETDDQAVEEACECKPRYMQAQIDHYTPKVTDWENTPGYEAWKQIFAGMQARTKPEGIVP